MADKEPVRRPYEVLYLFRRFEHTPQPNRPVFEHLGVIDAGSADAAITIAAEREEKPRGGRFIAVPQSNWNEREVDVTMEPRFSLAPPGTPPPPPEPAEPRDPGKPDDRDAP